MKRDYSEQVFIKVIRQLKEIRLAKGISHQTLAKEIGVTRPAISFIESGKRKPSLLLCLKIAEALGVSLGDLIKKYE